jgi:colanic acid biosynthesis protein WcaH
MLSSPIFKTIVENTPLVSIDICLVHANKILLGKRKNEPLKEQWFTPGGRILKNESWQDCLKRVAYLELGYKINDIRDFNLMGVWNHFYTNSSVDKKISTHYVNLPHYCLLKEQPIVIPDEQHESLAWFDLEDIEDNKIYNKYMQSYASWLINMGALID